MRLWPGLAILLAVMSAWGSTLHGQSPFSPTVDVGDVAADSRVVQPASAAKSKAPITAKMLALKKQELENEQLSRRIRQVQIELLDEKVKWMSADVDFSQQDLQDQLVVIDKQEADLKNALRSAEFNLQYAENEFMRARQQSDGAAGDKAEFTELIELKQFVRQYHQQQVSSLSVRLQRLANERQIWNRRFAVITEAATTDELITWRDETRKLADQLQREKRLEQMRIDGIHEDIANREKDPLAVGNEEVRAVIERQQEQLGQLIQLHNTNIVSIEGASQLADKLLAEIESDMDEWSFTEWAAGAWHYVTRIWNVEIINVDGNPLTVGKLIIGIILLLLGFVLSRKLSRVLGGRLQHGRFRLNESAAHAIQSLSFYALLVFCTLTALRFVNVPLTMFTFLGGAIAIGVGFGSQNILNNFISGLIILAERPIKVGDLIQLDELYGTVHHIGARSTRIRTGNNLDIIVPNSKFLESNVVNLTLGDDKLRTYVTVGVIYGSPTRDVTRLLKHAAEEHGRVLDRPEPFVWFTDFGDNALIFELHFWLKMRTIADRRRIESDVRYRIDQLFRDAGLVIAFPQRDIHLDTTTPLDIRLLSPEGKADPADAVKSSAA